MVNNWDYHFDSLSKIKVEVDGPKDSDMRIALEKAKEVIINFFEFGFHSLTDDVIPSEIQTYFNLQNKQFMNGVHTHLKALAQPRVDSNSVQFRFNGDIGHGESRYNGPKNHSIPFTAVEHASSSSVLFMFTDSFLNSTLWTASRMGKIAMNGTTEVDNLVEYFPAILDHYKDTEEIQMKVEVLHKPEPSVEIRDGAFYLKTKVRITGDKVGGFIHRVFGFEFDMHVQITAHIINYVHLALYFKDSVETCTLIDYDKTKSMTMETCQAFTEDLVGHLQAVIQMNGLHLPWRVNGVEVFDHFATLESDLALIPYGEIQVPEFRFERA